METLTIEQINDLNRTELDAYFWKLHFYMEGTLLHKISKEINSQYNYVSKRLKP